MLNENIEAFIVYMQSFSLNLMSIYPTQKAQIALLITKKVQILTKYLNFSDIFLKKKTLVLSKVINLNQHIIKLQKS